MLKSSFKIMVLILAGNSEHVAQGKQKTMLRMLSYQTNAFLSISVKIDISFSGFRKYYVRLFLFAIKYEMAIIFSNPCV